MDMGSKSFRSSGNIEEIPDQTNFQLRKVKSATLLFIDCGKADDQIAFRVDFYGVSQLAYDKLALFRRAILLRDGL